MGVVAGGWAVFGVELQQNWAAGLEESLLNDQLMLEANYCSVGS
jgi:hypothetical protein